MITGYARDLASLPVYKCHKEIRALKIANLEVYPTVTGPKYIIYPEDTRYIPFEVSVEYFGKHQPKPGGYWVLYNDGYESFSPAEALEEGYTLILDPLSNQSNKGEKHEKGSKNVPRTQGQSHGSVGGSETQEESSSRKPPIGASAPGPNSRVPGSGHDYVGHEPLSNEPQE